MSKNLIIVESPNKIQTIKSYLGSDYEVIASYGHLREMNKKNGYDPKTFKPHWVIINSSNTRLSKEAIVKQILKETKKAENIFLATDPDREGEAISWHIYDILDENDKQKCCRITFNEISKNAILNSIQNKHELDMNLVHSQFTRRIIDRLVGYKLSSLVRRTAYGTSAGRVQSVALMFIVSRELERRNFVPSKWYEISALLDNGIELSYTAKDKNYKKYTESESDRHNFKFADINEVNQVISEIDDKFKFIKYSEDKLTKGDSYLPLTTDKMLQVAGSSLGWSASKTTLVAQKLFEGVQLDGKHVGLITYPRTDSQRINEDFLNTTKQYLSSKFGNEYVNWDFIANSASKKTKKAKKNEETNQNVQDAHEAIRPVDATFTPDKLKGLVDDSVVALYSLIWSRTMACVMTNPIYTTKGMYFDNNGHEFYSSVKRIQFMGYLVLGYFHKVANQFKDNKIPELQVNNIYLGKTNINEFDKQPPAYFTEATLIAALKESGVGRPSTYAAMAKISETRGYVNKDKQKLIPTEMGMKVIEELDKHFPDVIDPKFTSNMETELDKIANGNEVWTSYLEKFAPEFETKIREIFKNTEKRQVEKAGRDCPKCGSELVIRESRYKTKFVACSAFPKCKYAEFDNSSNLIDEKCPECGGDLVRKKNRYGQEFIGCSSYPNCRYIKKENAK